VLVICLIARAATELFAPACAEPLGCGTESRRCRLGKHLSFHVHIYYCDERGSQMHPPPFSLSILRREVPSLSSQAERLFPDKAQLYEIIYESRFCRLWEQFRKQGGDSR
jgi:hypothetical protein